MDAGVGEVNNHIKSMRKEKGLRQEDLAKACEVSRQTIIAIENDKYDPSLDLAMRLARVLGTSVEQLFVPSWTVGKHARWS